MNKLILTTLLFFCLGSLGCGAKSELSDIYDDDAEKCSQYEIDQICLLCGKMNDCSHVEYEKVCYSGYRHKEDYQACLDDGRDCNPCNDGGYGLP